MPADPLLVVPDRAPGLIRALGECFSCSVRQRCLAHRMRNLAAKVPTDPWPEFEVRTQRTVAVGCVAKNVALQQTLH